LSPENLNAGPTSVVGQNVQQSPLNGTPLRHHRFSGFLIGVNRVYSPALYSAHKPISKGPDGFPNPSGTSGAQYKANAHE